MAMREDAAGKDLSSSLEDYLEAIYVLSQEDGYAPAKKIGTLLGVGKSSVSWGLQQLAEKGLIHYKPYEAVELTEAGRAKGKKLVSRHEGITRFLRDVLGMDGALAEANACRMEHVVDREVVQRMRDVLEKGTVREPAEGMQDKGELPKVSKDRDEGVVERLEEVLQEGGRSLGREERAVIDVFMASEHHRDLRTIWQEAKAKDESVDLSAAERAMQILCEYKIARSIRFRDQVLYEHHHPESHHDHLFCVKCGSIVEFYDPRLEKMQEENAEKSGYRLLTHRLDIFGVCQRCLKRESEVRPLSECLTGERIRVVQVLADEETQERIAAMGLRAGVIVDVLNDGCAGRSKILMVEQTRLMLDCDLADKVRVVYAGTDACCGRRMGHRHRAESW